MGIKSITNCQGLPSNMFLSMQNTHNNLGVNLQDWGDRQYHPSTICYQFLPKKSSQREALYRWVFSQIKRHPPSSLLCNHAILARYIAQSASGCQKTFSSRPTRDLTPLFADQQLANNWPITDQYCAISCQSFWLKSCFLVIFHC